MATNQDPTLPGEFNAGPGRMAEAHGVPATLPGPSSYNTGYPQNAGGVPPRPIQPIDELHALYVTDPADDGAQPDPLNLE